MPNKMLKNFLNHS